MHCINIMGNTDTNASTIYVMILLTFILILIYFSYSSQTEDMWRKHQAKKHTSYYPHSLNLPCAIYFNICIHIFIYLISCTRSLVLLTF